MAYYYKHVFHPAYPLGGVTFAIDHDKETNEVKMSWSVCSENDMFSRSIGRDIANQNMTDGVFILGKFDKELNVFQNIMNLFINHSPKNTWEKRYKEQAIDRIRFYYLVDLYVSDAYG